MADIKTVHLTVAEAQQLVETIQSGGRFEVKRDGMRIVLFTPAVPRMKKLAPVVDVPAVRAQAVRAGVVAKNTSNAFQVGDHRR